MLTQGASENENESATFRCLAHRLGRAHALAPVRASSIHYVLFLVLAQHPYLARAPVRAPPRYGRPRDHGPGPGPILGVSSL